MFDELRRANENRQKEWDRGNLITSVYRSNELAGEVGEVCNVVKKLERERIGIRGSRDTVEHLAEELADVVICVDLLAMHFGVDLWKAVVAKFNKTSVQNNLAERLGTDPLEGWTVGEPHFVDSEDCMGHPQRYWRCIADHTATKRTAWGHGTSKEQARRDCVEKIKALGPPAPVQKLSDMMESAAERSVLGDKV